VRDPFGIDWAFNEPSAESKAKMAESAAQASPVSAPGAVEDLLITRILDAPRAAVWRCWTEGDLLKQWFCPKPWYVSVADIDVRAGGASRIVMNGPNGERNDLQGQYLAVVPQTHLSTTDAFVGDWRPSTSQPFMASFVDLTDEPGGKTRMVWGTRHWRAEDRTTHLAMGFDAGWNAAADQLEALARSIA
jgi:uncharacterized protein YndB with AHSA1/START domain